MAKATNQTRGATLAANLAVADTFFRRLRGLLGTRPGEFAAGCGLWITPSKGVHMLGMRFAIDAVYLDGAHRVIHCEPHLRPGHFGPIRRAAAGVLELPAGTIAATRTQPGDLIEFDDAASKRC